MTDSSGVVERLWTPDQFWEFIEGLADEWSASQMRETMVERGLTIVPATLITELQAERECFRLSADKNYKLWADERDARIAAESTLSRIQSETVELRTLEIAARKYFSGYVQDEAAERECCVSDAQHEDAKALQNALAALRSLTNESRHD